MANPKLGQSKNGSPMHYSVGAIIKQGSKYLMIDRARPPFGFACVAGHIDEDESTEEALLREVKEESGLDVKKYEIVAEEELDFNTCRHGITVHYFYVFSCEVEGEINQNMIETKSIDWYTVDEMKKLKLEPVWDYWFKKLGII